LNVIRLYVCLGELVSDERNYLIDSLKLWQIHLRVKTQRKIIELGLEGIYGVFARTMTRLLARLKSRVLSPPFEKTTLLIPT